MEPVVIGIALFAIFAVAAGVAAVCSAPPLFTNPRSNMREPQEPSKSKVAAFSVGCFLLLLLFVGIVAFFSNGLQYAINKTFMPLNEQVRHETFECSASHSDGIAREIRQYQDQYNELDPADQKTPGTRVVIRQRVLQEAEAQTGTDCPLPQDVQSFVQSLR
jgi:hypothetical protein